MNNQILKKLDIEGFGANKKLSLEFSPNVTTIIGKSYKGKSWALRALKNIMLNEPAGTSYINWNSDKTRIKLLIDNKKVVKVRSKTINSYRLSGKKEPYVAFGNNVPDDIAELMNVSDVNFRGVNRLGQHEPPFWLCETAGEVSRQLNSIIDLEVIDKTLASIDSEKLETTTLIKVLKKDVEKAKKQKKVLEHIKERNEDLTEIENLQKSIENISQKHTTLSHYISSAIKHKSNIKIQKERLSDIAIILDSGKSYQILSTKIQRLSNLIDNAKRHQQLLKNKPPDIKFLVTIKDEYTEICNKTERLNNLIAQAKERKEQKCQAWKNIKEIQQKINEITKDKCPVCGSPMKL